MTAQNVSQEFERFIEVQNVIRSFLDRNPDNKIPQWLIEQLNYAQAAWQETKRK